MVSKNWWQAVGFFLCFAHFQAIAQSPDTEEIQPTPLKLVKASKRQLTDVCVQIYKKKALCEGQSHQIYLANEEEDVEWRRDYYYINEAPLIALLSKEGNGYKLKTYWDFYDYAHSSAHDQKFTQTGQPLQPERLKIHPVLYPISSLESVIPVIQVFSNHYSEGGAIAEYADFVQLDFDGIFTKALDGIPFYQKEQQRACFSEQEYKQSPHCYEESQRILHIKFSDDTQRYYQWELNYTDKIWAAHKPKSEQETKTLPPLLARPYKAVKLEWEAQ